MGGENETNEWWMNEIRLKSEFIVALDNKGKSSFVFVQ